VLEGTYEIDGMTLGEDMLVVAKDVAPRPFKVAASKDSACLAMGVSFCG
jgi:hypothetical protein